MFRVTSSFLSKQVGYLLWPSRIQEGSGDRVSVCGYETFLSTKKEV